jgi:hypothetical protein
MDAKSKEDGLSNVVQTRLGKIFQEQEALRNAVYRRLAEREVALKKLKKFSKIDKKLKNSQETSTNIDSESIARSEVSLTLEKKHENAEGNNTNDITVFSEESRKHLIEHSGSTAKNVDNNMSDRQPGPWLASIRPNLQLQRLLTIRKQEEEERRLQHPILMKRELEEKQQKERERTLQLSKRSNFLRETRLSREKENARREEDKLKETKRAEQKLFSKLKTIEKKILMNREQFEKTIENKINVRKKRELKAKIVREQKGREERIRKKNFLRHLEESSKIVQQRMEERRALLIKNHKKRDKDHQKKVEEFLASTKEQQERDLRARNIQREQILAEQKEKKKVLLLNYIQKRNKKIMDARHRKYKINRHYMNQKLKLMSQTEEKIIAIEEEQMRKKFLTQKLQEQLKVPNSEFRKYAINVLNDVSKYENIEELRQVGLELEQHFSNISEQQKLESWESYTEASQQEVWSSPSRPATAATMGCLGRSSGSRNRRSRSRHGFRRSRGEMEDEQEVNSREETSSSYGEESSGRRIKPSRPQSSNFSRNRLNSPGKRHRSIRSNRPSTAGVMGGRRKRSNELFSSFPKTKSRGKTCALCRKIYRSLPHRVLRKAVLEVRALLGIPQANIKRWRTAVYYDQVSVCQLCHQFVEQPSTSRFDSNAPCGPSRKSPEQVEKEREAKMMKKISGSNNPSDSRKDLLENKHCGSSNSKNSNKKSSEDDEKSDTDVVITVRVR